MYLCPNKERIPYLDTFLVFKGIMLVFVWFCANFILYRYLKYFNVQKSLLNEPSLLAWQFQDVFCMAVLHQSTYDVSIPPKLLFQLQRKFAMEIQLAFFQKGQQQLPVCKVLTDWLIHTIEVCPKLLACSVWLS